MVLAHRQELIWQAKEKIQRVTGLSVDVEMGEFKADNNAGLFHRKSAVVVSTIQTHIAGGDGSGRIGKFDPMEFGLLIIDEAHHATSPSYRRILEYYLTNPKLLVLGVTATPDRQDEEALGQIFSTVGYDYELLDAIRDGWLVPIDQQMVNVDSLDFSKVRTTAGDLNGADLAAVMESEKNLHGIASSTIDIIGSKRGIGFAASVNHARVLSEIFNRHRAGMSAFVYAGTDKEERNKIVRDFTQGKIQWLWNCGVFTEGFDVAGVEVISMGRPTKSRALYAQMIGRATRPHESISHTLNECPNIPALRRGKIARSEKKSCLIIDFVGNSGKHKLMSSADVLGGNLSERVLQQATMMMRKAGKPVRTDDVLAEEEERERKRLEAEARKAKLTATATYKMQAIDPFAVLDVRPVASRGWDDGKTLTEKQRGILKKAGYDPDKMEYVRARQLVGIIVDRWVNHKCSIKQAATLEKFGYDKKEASGMTFENASKAIDAIAKNGWKRPTVTPAFAQTDDDIPF